MSTAYAVPQRSDRTRSYGPPQAGRPCSAPAELRSRRPHGARPGAVVVPDRTGHSPRRPILPPAGRALPPPAPFHPGDEPSSDDDLRSRTAATTRVGFPIGLHVWQSVTATRGVCAGGRTTMHPTQDRTTGQTAQPNTPPGDPRLNWSGSGQDNRPPALRHRRDGILPTVAAALSVRGETLTTTAGKSDQLPARPGLPRHAQHRAARALHRALSGGRAALPLSHDRRGGPQQARLP
jgi:hypothetical protein